MMRYMPWEAVGVVVALVLGVASLAMSWSTARKDRATQERLAAIEEKRRDEELVGRKQASVTASFLPSAQGRGLRLFNGGPAVADLVKITMVAPIGPGALPHILEGPSALNLQPQQEFTFVTAIVAETAPAVEARLEWADGAGHQQRALTLEVP